MSEYYAVVRKGQSPSLQHFGVVGMRWGIRHDKRVQAAKRRWKTNKNAKTREEWMKEREKAANRLYSLNGKAVNKTLARQSTGKTIAKVALLGSKGSLAYEKGKAKSGSRLGGAAAGLATNAVSNVHANIKGRRVNVGGLATEAASWGYYAANRKARKKNRK